MFLEEAECRGNPYEGKGADIYLASTVWQALY